MKNLFIFLSCFILQYSQAASKEAEFTDKVHPCFKDYPTHCKVGSPPTLENEYQCLYDNFDSLAKSCQTFITTTLSFRPCTADIMKLCQGPNRNLNRSAFCLRNNATNLSQECSTWLNKALSKAQNATEEIETVCKKDFISCEAFRGNGQGACVEKLYNEKKLSSMCVKLYEKFKNQQNKR